MKIRTYASILFLLCSTHLTFSQMVTGQDTLVGNEWIRYDQTYYKFYVGDDGIYRITRGALVSAGIPLSTIVGADMRMYSLGQQVAIHVSTDGAFGENDYIEFFGKRNRSEMDQFLFKRPGTDMLNPDYSLYTDKRPYYLAIDGTQPLSRVTELINHISNPPAPQEYYLHTESVSFHTTGINPYFLLPDGGSISYSSYMHGAGFARHSENTSTTPVATANRFNNGPDGRLHVRFSTTSNGPHTFFILFNEHTLDTVVVVNQVIVDRTYTVPVTWLADNNEVKVINQDNWSRHALVGFDLTYARMAVLQMDPVAFITLEGKTGDQFFSFSGFPYQGVSPVVYTADGKNRMIASHQAGNVVFTWPETNETVTLHLAEPVAAIRQITSFEEKHFTDLSADDTEYIVITHPALMEPGESSAYIQYRSSPEGGGYKAKAYSILDLYDQFGYGIDKHPQSVRNFVEFFDRNWPSAKMIFIVGRAIEYFRSRETGVWEEYFFVPTFGQPGADNLLAATLWDLVPRYPIGRLAIVDQQGIADYLEKVKAHDASRFAAQTLEEKAWLKNVMHIGGGKTAGEQSDFKTILTSMGNILEASDYGAKVHYFQKQSTDIIGESQNAQIDNLLRQGTSIINYLGHSATSTFEFNIIDPAAWNNAGRYPIFSAMGCSAGQIHNTLFSLSDRYVHIPDEGTVAFISGSGSQYASALANWGTPWYEYIGNTGYGGTLGQSVLRALDAISVFVNPDQTTSNQYRFLLEQQTFQGDPALLLHPLPGPDYVVDRKSVSIQPAILDTKLDSFRVAFTINNIGRNLRQDLSYDMLLRYPDGSEKLVKSQTVPATKFEIPVRVYIPLTKNEKAGVYRLKIRLDPSNVLEELPAPDAEANNVLIDNLGIEGIEFVIVDNLITAAYPQDFAIVNTHPQLVATSNNAFVKRQDIMMQIDTTALFNSPMLVKEKFVQHLPTLKWAPAMALTPGQVYYWRVSTDSISPEQGFIWSTRSFIYLPGSSKGWNQSHFHQLTDNVFDQMLTDSSRHDFHFATKARNFNIVNRFHDVAGGLVPLATEDGVIRAEFFTGFRDRNVQVFVSVIDSLTGEFLRNPNPGLHGSSNHLSFATRVFPYAADDPASRQALINFVENIIEPGDYVFIYTYQRPTFPDYFPEQWAADEAVFGKSIFTMIEGQYPSSAVRTLATTGSKPYIIFFQKDRGVISEIIAADINDVIGYSFDIQSALKQGSRMTDLIGPSKQWYSIRHALHSIADTSDVNELAAWALSKSLADTIWIPIDIHQPLHDISHIDARAYPYLQMSLRTIDSIDYSPASIDHWRVLYEGYPEVVINPDLGFEFVSDSLTQGELMRMVTFIENISDYPIDSIPVSLRIINPENSAVEMPKMIYNLGAHATAPVIYEKGTETFSGDYRVLLEINPGRTVDEVEYANNLGVLPMHVQGDDINPILDVTFDGVHILDGDLVSSKPFILVRLQDENVFLKLEDTASFELYLQFPSELEPRRVFFAEDWVRFVGADPSGKNVASVELTPDLVDDGIYRLQVRAEDASGNVSGNNDYAVSFEVINEESVSHLYNYPNPFSTATRFVYTLTGDGSPAHYKIQIMSISGRVVREITQDELGPLRVGTHMTDYVWDGTDESGDRLAAGTYIYRMIVKNENLENVKRYETSGDKTYFRKGWGKLVILR